MHHHLKQFVNLVVAEIDQRERPAGGAGQRRFQVEAQAVEDRGHDIGRLDRSSAGTAPIGSLLPTTRPPFTPPPRSST